MNFTKSMEEINLKVRQADLGIEEGNEFNPNLALIMPKVLEYYGNHAHALCLCHGTDASNMNDYIKGFVKRLDCVNDEIIYSKTLLRKMGRKYDLIIALDACEPLRKAGRLKRKFREKTLIHNIKKLLFKDGIALFEEDVNKELLKGLKTTSIGNKFRIIITEK